MPVVDISQKNAERYKWSYFYVSNSILPYLYIYIYNIHPMYNSLYIQQVEYAYIQQITNHRCHDPFQQPPPPPPPPQPPPPPPPPPPQPPPPPPPPLPPPQPPPPPPPLPQPPP